MKNKPKKSPVKVDAKNAAATEIANALKALNLLKPLNEIAGYMGISVDDVVAVVEAAQPNNGTQITGQSEFDAAEVLAWTIKGCKVPIREIEIGRVTLYMPFLYRGKVPANVLGVYIEGYKHAPLEMLPVVLWDTPHGLRLLDGIQRFQACIKAGRATIRAVILKCTSSEVASMVPVRLNENHGLRFGQKEKGKAIQQMLIANPKLQRVLRINKKGKPVTTASIARIFKSSKATVSKALTAVSNRQRELDFAPAFEYLEYDIALDLIEAQMQHLTRAKSLPVSESHLSDLATIHHMWEALLCGITNTKTKSLRGKMREKSKFPLKELGDWPAED